MRLKKIKLSSFISKEWLSHFGKTLKYSLYVIFHPFDGFWDLTHEKRGSVGAANFLVFLFLMLNILKLQFTSFLVRNINLNRINMWVEIASVIAPILLWCVSNWSFTTLMDGKGRLKEVYMGTAYALTPMIIIGYPNMILSNFLTIEEITFYTFFDTLGMIWFVALVLAAMMMIHDYSLTKTVFSSILTIVGMAVIVFILVVFFSLISDGIAYFVSVYQEIQFRFY